MPILIERILASNQLSLEHVFAIKNKIYTFLNPVSYLTALDHRNVFSQFDGIFADGSVLVSAIRMLYGQSITRRSFDMTSLAPELFSFAEKHKKTIYIVASQQEQVEQAIKIFRQRWPGLDFVGYRNGYFNSEKEMEEEAEKIAGLQPDFLIAGMGVLTQETFLLKIREAGFQGIGFTCGGFIHQTAKNEIDYYPDWAGRMNMRFLYRMYKEKHTRKRYLQAALLFPSRFIHERLFG